MNEPGKLMFVDLQNDEYELHMGIWASNGYYQSFQDVYIYRDDLNKWAEDLRTFPRDLHHTAIFQYGIDDSKFYAKVRLTAFVYESTGASALEVVVDNHAERPFQARAEFCIHCSPAAIKELGEMILDWDTQKNLMMEWMVPQGD